MLEIGSDLTVAASNKRPGTASRSVDRHYNILTFPQVGTGESYALTFVFAPVMV
jgi:hypothetical protein